MKSRFFIYLLALILVVSVSGYFYSNLNHSNGNEVIDAVSYFGSIASVFGIIVTLVELYHTESIAKSSSNEVRKKLESITKSEIHTNLINSKNECDLIRLHVEHDEIKEAIKKWRELMDGMSIIKGERNIWISEEERSNLKRAFVKSKMDLETLLRVEEDARAFDKAKIKINLEDTRLLLSQIEIKVHSNEQYGEF